MFLIHLPALFQGGIANSGFLWFFLFPLFAIFLTGRKAGVIWIAALFFAIINTLILSPQLSLPYEPIYLLFLLIALALESSYVLFSHNIQDRYEKELSIKNRELKHLTFNLQEEVNKQVAITRSKDHLLSQQSKMASVGEMLSNISHQWKQPLSTINVLIQNVHVAEDLGDDNVDELIHVTLHSILNQTDLMQTTMQDFLSFSRPDVDNIYFSITHALKMMQTLIQPSFKFHEVELIFKEPLEDYKLFGKENELVHAIMNIANNAKDALVQSNVEEAKVTITLMKDQEHIMMYICDNAGGISDDVLPHIFDPYFSTKLDNGGTGLGLHMSAKIIQESFKGSIKVVNNDLGACFIISFKALDA